MESRQAYIDRLIMAFVSMRKSVMMQQSNVDSFWLPHAQSEAFMLIDHAGALSVGELAKKLQVTSGAVTQLIDPLVVRGFVQRVPSNKDRRTIHLSLTESGQKFKKDMKRAKQKKIAELLSVLNDEELRSITALMEKISTTPEDLR
jgi:DNA-binding MarR family transcriptional regulator